MSIVTPEDKKKERIKKLYSKIVENRNPKKFGTKIRKLLKGKLTKKKEFSIEQLIKDLKSEEKLSKGDRGAAEAMPKKNFERSVFISRVKKFNKGMSKVKPLKKKK